ncbi:UDP:flavonoid glycosyltransferase YjiC (YdhE family) [Labrenzia sp. EL_13]|nr:UDP:flavonoid glycosyltransferase YjiC (YdhE family) [Labrenzia sp. EL_13]
MARSAAVRLDICVFADIRKGDVAAPLHAAALEAFVAAGYSVGVLPVAPSTIEADAYSVDPRYHRLFQEDRITRLAPGAIVECALALSFDVRLFAEPWDQVCRIKADHRIVTLERPAALASLTAQERECVAENAREALGGPVVWAPNSRLSRDALSALVPHWPATERDWNPVIPDCPPGSRDVIERARPVVGMARIARSRPGTWPVSVREGARAFRVSKVMWRLRAAPNAERPVWPQSAPMEVWPDDQIDLADFLASIDILANADLAADDPCPAEAMMALGNRVVPFLEPEYRAVFAGSAIYGRPSELAQRALEFHENPDLAADLRNSGKDLVSKVYSPRPAVERVQHLIGAPRPNPYTPAVHAMPGGRALFFSTNGVGLGHLTRQLAVSRRMPARLTPVFVSHSQAVDVVGDYGYVAEYLPYHAAYGERKEHWNAALAEALTTAIEFYDPRVVVFDGNVPFAGLMKALDSCPGVARVWIRRALWGPDRDLDALERGSAFDLILEPGEHAWARDDGPTVARREQALQVPPVRLLDEDELLEREAACDEIGLDPDQTNVLVALGSGNNIDTSRMTARALAHLHGRHGVGATVAQWRIADTQADLPAGVTRLTDYPFGKFLRAFDFAIAAAGYNTFAEHIAEGLPTVWVPNEHAQQDRQILRARYAEARGLGCLVRHSADFGLNEALDRMLHSETRAQMRNAHLQIEDDLVRNGANTAAEAITVLSETVIVRERPASLAQQVGEHLSTVTGDAGNDSDQVATKNGPEGPLNNGGRSQG